MEKQVTSQFIPARRAAGLPVTYHEQPLLEKKGSVLLPEAITTSDIKETASVCYAVA